MPLALSAVVVDQFTRQIAALDTMLGKLAVHCETKKIDPTAFLNARLYPDMFAFTRQVQIACDFAKMAGARLAGQEPPSHPDTETTIEDLRVRCRKVIDYLASLDRAAIDAGADRSITFRTGPESAMTLPGAAYLTGFILPNVYFHAATAYAILRHNGLDIGKRDFMGMG